MDSVVGVGEGVTCKEGGEVFKYYCRFAVYIRVCMASDMYGMAVYTIDNS